MKQKATKTVLIDRAIADTKLRLTDAEERGKAVLIEIRVLKEQLDTLEIIRDQEEDS